MTLGKIVLSKIKTDKNNLKLIIKDMPKKILIIC